MTLQQKYEAASNRADALAGELETEKKKVANLSAAYTRALSAAAAKSVPSQIVPVVVAAAPSTIDPDLRGLDRTIAAMSRDSRN